MDGRHTVSIERALNTGATIEIGGTPYTFTALTLGDLAHLSSFRKGAALMMYLSASQHCLVDQKTRFDDMHDIMMRGTRECDVTMDDAPGLWECAYLSLRHAHPDITRDAVDELLSSPDGRPLIKDLLTIQNYGPLSKKQREGGGEASDPLASPAADSPLITTRP